MAYTKLFSSIVTSTIWTEDDKTRIVWITMLALADKNGEVQASVPGLARIAGVPISDTEAALERFLAPDPYSRTPDDEGRRIEKIDGGWALLNHAKYRDMASDEDRKRKAAIRQKRFREHMERKNSNASVTHANASVTLMSHQNSQADTDTDSKAEADPLTTPLPPSEKPKAKPEPPLPSVAEREFAEFWEAYPRKSGKLGALRKWKQLRPDLDRCLAAIEIQRKTDQWTRDGGQFIPHPATWLNQGRWDDAPKIETKRATDGKAANCEPDPDGWRDWILQNYPNAEYQPFWKVAEAHPDISEEFRKSLAPNDLRQPPLPADDSTNTKSAAR